MKSFFVRYLWFGIFAIVIAGCGGSSGSGGITDAPDGHHHDHDHPEPRDDVSADVVAMPFDGNECVDGVAAVYPCLNMDMLGGLSFSVEASDIWGWADAANGDEYAILGLSTGTAFIRVTSPTQPEFVGFLPTATTSSGWRDIKVIRDHALIVSEATGHGLQVVDLSVLAALTEPTFLTADTHYTGFGSAHNIAINEESGFAYAVGSNTCGGGLHMIDMFDPQSPRFAGCYAGDSYTHDVQCVDYAGSDSDYVGRELCFAANEDTLTIVDVTDKQAPSLIARRTYAGVSYAHQGWLSEDHRYFFMGDETDELALSHNTRTYLWDITDLDAPVQSYTYTATTSAIDHNLYVLEDHIYQANYEAGVRVLRTGNLAAGEVAEIAFFDTVPGSDRPEFDGVWSVYPYLSSGTILTANDSGEFFALRAHLQAISRCSDGLDNDSDGAVDYPADTECSSAVADFEE